MAGFTIPNDPAAGVNAASFSAQAQPDKVDIDILVAGFAGTGVLSGCAVTANGSGLTVDIAAGSIAVAGVQVSVTGVSKTPGTADASNPRIDLVVVNSSGTVSVTAGTAAAAPCSPNVPASSVCLAQVLVTAALTTMTASRITDRRVFISASSSTPSQVWSAQNLT